MLEYNSFIHLKYIYLENIYFANYMPGILVGDSDRSEWNRKSAFPHGAYRLRERETKELSK